MKPGAVSTRQWSLQKREEDTTSIQDAAAVFDSHFTETSLLYSIFIGAVSPERVFHGLPCERVGRLARIFYSGSYICLTIR